MTITMLGIAVWLICGVLSAVVAQAKNRDAIAWLLIGATCGVFGLIAIVGMPSLPAAHAQQVAPTAQPRAAVPMSRARRDLENTLVFTCLVVLVIVGTLIYLQGMG